MILSPSLLSSDFSRLGAELTALEEAGLSWVHWDVMDGAFVPNITFGPPVIKCLRAKSTLFFDVHLMIREPERHLEAFADAGANMLVVHAETCTHLHRTITAIQELGMKAGAALNPATPVSALENVLDILDMALVMTVNPGFGGQKFIPSTLKKVQALRAMTAQDKPDFLIQVDGGVTPENAGEISRAGANVFVAGSAFFQYPPYAQRRVAFEQSTTRKEGTHAPQ